MNPAAPGAVPRVPVSATEGVIWPALPASTAATRLALLHQFEASQWWPADLLRAQQGRQLSMLLTHALRTVPFYGERLRAAGYRAGGPQTPEVWDRIPVLSRKDVQGAGPALHSTQVPAAHGKVGTTTTSGSTGKPVTVAKTGLAQLYWECVTLRNHLWQRRDLTRKLAVIRSVGPGRARYPKGAVQSTWSGGTASVFPTGPSALLSADTSISNQALWLQRVNPDYLLTLPTNLLHLADYCHEKGIDLPALRDVGTLGGVVQAQVREACRRAWGAPVIDMYSAQEVGYIALQCPVAEHYHVQAETVLVEILDDRGRPCAPGTWGRVVVTPLHNLAMPLIRYDIGDYAEVGAPCACGRGLPVLRQILGRARNMMTLPSGEKISPAFVNDWFEGLPVAQFQIVQRALDRLEIKVVPLRPFTEAEERSVRAQISDRLGAPFRVAFSYHDEIPREPGGKFEDFKSELDPS